MTTISCGTVDTVISFAIEKEEQAMSFYQHCADRTKHQSIKEFFLEMASEERRHCELLRDLDLATLSSVKLAKVEDLHISDYMIDVKFHEQLTYQEALVLSMKKEEKAHAFYLGWKDKCMHEKTAGIFGMLADEELKHKRKIEIIYDEEILAWD